jgi:hypothetical protein
MVIKIHQTVNTENALMYNEQKVAKGVAEFFASGNTLSANPFQYNEKHRLKIFADIEQNSRVKNKCLHISINPSTSDYAKLGDETIRKEITNLLQHLGYENQPYFVYKPADVERVHFHVVSTRIDKQTGKKIKDSNERKKVQQFIKSLEQKYGPTSEKAKQNVSFNFSADSAYLKQNLQDLFKELNRLESIINKQLYDRALAKFNVEIRQSGCGHVVFINDDNGNPVRYPIRLSEFMEKPRFYIASKLEQQLQQAKPIIDKFQLGQLARDLHRLIDIYSQENRKHSPTIKKVKKARPRRF